MKIYIKQKVFSWRDRFAVKDASGADRYYAQGELFSWGRKLHIYAQNGQEVAFVRQKMWSWRPSYFIELGGCTYKLVREFTFFKQRLHVEGLPWVMRGNFWAHEYTLHDGQNLIMQMSKHWFTWGDSYELDIPNPQNELLCLGIALAVDCMQADAQNN